MKEKRFTIWNHGEEMAILHGNSQESTINSYIRHLFFGLEPKLGAYQMELKFCVVEWDFGAEEREWTDKVNTPTLKSVSDWESNLSV